MRAIALVATLLVLAPPALAGSGSKPRVFDRNTIRDGVVRSKQRALLRVKTKARANSLAGEIQQIYARKINGALPFLRSRSADSGKTTFSLLGIPLIKLGAVHMAGEGRARRLVEGGILAAKGARGERGKLDVAVRLREGAADVTLDLHDFRATIRGKAKRAPIRQKIYELTQLAVHRIVCKGFLQQLGASLGETALAEPAP